MGVLIITTRVLKNTPKVLMITSGVIDVGDGFRIMYEPHKSQESYVIYMVSHYKNICDKIYLIHSLSFQAFYSGQS